MANTILPLSFKAGVTVTAYRVLKISAADTVTPRDTVTAFPIGIGLNNVLETGTGVPVAGPGNIAKLLFNETMTAGGLVTSDANGLGTPHVDTTAGSFVVGVLVGPSVALTATLSDVLVQPFFKSIP